MKKEKSKEFKIIKCKYCKNTDEVSTKCTDLICCDCTEKMMNKSQDVSFSNEHKDLNNKDNCNNHKIHKGGKKMETTIKKKGEKKTLVLKLLSEGKTIDEIATETGIKKTYVAVVKKIDFDTK